MVKAVGRVERIPAKGESEGNPEESLPGASTGVTIRWPTDAGRVRKSGQMEVACERVNRTLADQRVVKNKGAAGGTMPSCGSHPAPRVLREIVAGRLSANLKVNYQGVGYV